MKTAILNVADTGPLESLVVMLRSVGYHCHLPNERLRNELRQAGLDNVLEIKNLVDHWGYEPPMDLPYAGPDAMQFADLFVDVKMHRNGDRVLARWPSLRDKLLWYRINGTEPEHVVNVRGDNGDEVNLRCPILTPNLWYREDPAGNKHLKPGTPTGPNWGGMAYSVWPPYYRFDEHLPRHQAPYTAPMCLVHNLVGWGFGPVTKEFRELGIRCHGVGSPDGLLPHRECVARMSRSLCMVHMKSSDSPGYALYEALASGCPVVCSRRLPWRNRMEELFEDGVTCLMFDKPTHAPLVVDECVAEVKSCLERLSNPDTNARIGQAGRERLKSLMWSEKRLEDVESLRSFMVRHYGA